MEDRDSPETRTYKSFLSLILRPCALTSFSKRGVERMQQWGGGFGIFLEVCEWDLSLC